MLWLRSEAKMPRADRINRHAFFIGRGAVHSACGSKALSVQSGPRLMGTRELSLLPIDSVLTASPDS
jgi:hypothetical protein